MKNALLLPILLATAALPGRAQGQTPVASAVRTLPVDRIVAVVGDAPILMTNVQEVIYQRRAQGLTVPTDSAALVTLVRSVTNELIDEELLIARARVEKIEVTEAELNTQVDRELKRIRDRFKTELEYREALKANGIGTPEEYRRQLLDQARRSALQERVISKMRADGKISAPPVSETEVAEAFAKNQGSLPKRPALVGFRQVVLATRPSTAAREIARVKAESLLAEIRRGADFEQVAKRESMDQSNREVGGDLGWIRRGVTVPAFERWAFSLAPGVMSPVFETSFGWHVLRVDRVQPAEVKVRHVLIMATTDSTDTGRAQREADSVATAWRAGASYDSLAAKHHDEAGQEEKVLPEFDRSQLPAPYQAAFEGKAVNDIVGPFQIPNQRGAPKYVVAQLTLVKEGGQYTVTDLRQTIRDQLAQERGIRRFLDGLRKESYVAVMIDEAELAAGGGLQQQP